MYSIILQYTHSRSTAIALKQNHTNRKKFPKLEPFLKLQSIFEDDPNSDASSAQQHALET